MFAGLIQRAVLGSAPAVIAVGGAFTPASVSGLDLWIEADPAKLYSDNGTTPIVANDPVYLAKDKSSAARDLSQATLANRPLYKTDLAKPSLLFDGANDFLGLVSLLSWLDGTGQCWFAISAQLASTGSLQELITLYDGTTGGYVADVYVDTTAHMETRDASGSFVEDTQGTLTTGTPFVIIGTVTSSGGTNGTGQAEAFLDNVSSGATSFGAGTTRRTNTANLFIGSNATTHPVNGRIFGVCHGTGTLSSTDRGNLQTYLAGLHP